MTPDRFLRGSPPGLVSGLLFFAVVFLGCGYIVFSKTHEFAAFYVTSVPVLIMIAYAAALGLARLFRLRDDQSGDNLYYMGFLFTLTSLAVSLYQFSASGSAEQIVQNFGIAIASTIAGIALRIFFNQMRRDPVEVEHVARLELAEASRKVKRELESTVLEFSYFRRSTQQSLSDAAEEMNLLLKQAKDQFVGQLQDFAVTSSEPIKSASKRSGDSMEEFNTRAAKAIEGAARQVADESNQLHKSTVAIVKAIDGLVAKLTGMQTPEHIIEIKLNPTISGLSRAVNSFAKGAEAQAAVIDVNLKQTQKLSMQIAALVEQMQKIESERLVRENARADENSRTDLGGSLVTPEVAVQRP